MASFETGIDQPLDDHGHHQIAFAAALGSDQALQIELADHRQDGFDVTVGERLLRGEQVLGRNQRLIAQHAAQGFDLVLGPIGEVGQGALAGFLALAPAFAQEDGGRGVAVGDDVDVHANI